MCIHWCFTQLNTNNLHVHMSSSKANDDRKDVVGRTSHHINENWQNDTKINLLDKDDCEKRYKGIEQAVKLYFPIGLGYTLPAAERLIIDFTFSKYFYVSKIYIQIYHPLLEKINKNMQSQFQSYQVQQQQQEEQQGNEEKNDKLESSKNGNIDSNSNSNKNNDSIFLKYKPQVTCLNISNNRIFIKKAQNFGINNEFFKRLALGIELPCFATDQDISDIRENVTKRIEYGSKIRKWAIAEQFEENKENSNNNKGQRAEFKSQSQSQSKSASKSNNPQNIESLENVGSGRDQNKPKLERNNIVRARSDTESVGKNQFVLKTINKCLSQEEGLTKLKPIKLMMCDELAFIFHNFNDLTNLFNRGYLLFECNSYDDLRIKNRCNKYAEMIEFHFGFIQMLKVIRKSGDTDSIYVDLYYAMTFLDWSELNMMLYHFESKKYAWHAIQKPVDYHRYFVPVIKQTLDDI